MDPTLFDDLTKALATATSRRQALKAIGAAVGGALGLSRVGIAFAKCKAPGEKCSQSKQCCIGFCDPSTYTCSFPTTTSTTTTSTTTSTTTPACIPDGASCNVNGEPCCSNVMCCSASVGGEGICCSSGSFCNPFTGGCFIP